MTIENESSMKISNDQLLKDIVLTEKELEAYQKIADGFRALAMLPENAGTQAKILNFKADGYRNSETACAEFLKKLHALKTERGL